MVTSFASRARRRVLVTRSGRSMPARSRLMRPQSDATSRNNLAHSINSLAPWGEPSAGEMRDDRGDETQRRR